MGRLGNLHLAIPGGTSAFEDIDRPLLWWRCAVSTSPPREMHLQQFSSSLQQPGSDGLAPYFVCWTGANGIDILKVCFSRRNYNFYLEFDRVCVRSFCDGTTFREALNDTLQYALTLGMGRIF